MGTGITSVISGCKHSYFFCLFLMDSPLLWKAFHNKGESYRLKETQKMMKAQANNKNKYVF